MSTKSPAPNKPCHPATRRPGGKPRQPEALHPAALASFAHHGHTQPLSTKSPAPHKPCHPATRRPVKKKPPHDDKPRQPEALPLSSTRQLGTPRPHATHVYQEPSRQQTSTWNPLPSSTLQLCLAHRGHMQPMSTKSPAPNKPCHPATRRPVKRKPPHGDKPRQPEALPPSSTRQLSTPPPPPTETLQP